MLSRERILKLDILTPDDAKILSANTKQFSVPTATNNFTGRLETVLIIKGQDLPEIERNCEISVMMYMRSGERVKYPGFVRLSTRFQLNIVLRTSRAQVVEERRRYYKVNTNIGCVINSVVRNGSRAAVKNPAIAKITDLNVGGVFLCDSSEKLYKDDILMLTIDLTNKAVDISAEVIRVQVNVAGDITGYGCRFLNVTPAIEETIAKYVFQVQLEAIQKEESRTKQ